MTLRTTVYGDWHELKGLVKRKWGRITDDDLMRINGSREELIGELMSKYQMSYDEAEEEIDEYCS